MKAVLLNPPYKQRIVRRYKCSYNAPTFLLPPLELMYLGGITRAAGVETILIDAIAEGLSEEKTLARIRDFSPDVVVGITGLECMQSDLQVLDRIKSENPKSKVGVFGYLPTTYPEEVMKLSTLDFAFKGEPELSFQELIERLQQGASIDDLPGAAVRKNGTFNVNCGRPRNKSLDALPNPDRSLVNHYWYNEPGFGRPFTTMLTTRGCPFTCNFCVPMFGHETSFRSAEDVVDEIEQCVKEHGIKYIRFMDDVFNLNRKKTEQICQGMIDRKLNVRWTALSRVDTLNENVVKLMKQSGCMRLYIGIESGSQKVLDWYKKEQDVTIIPEKMGLLKKYGIEIMAFFIVGAPVETREDVQLSIDLAKRIDADYVLVDILTAYPGSDLFDHFRDNIRFSLMPYKIDMLDDPKQQTYRQWEKEFYKSFYYRPSYILPRIPRLLKTPVQTLQNFVGLTKYIMQPIDTPREHDKYI